ncbi:uncharacterized protein LOC127795227 [Diospyros lotus]|uniref:uncharacterized protein LOC127795227 n=1 Tax=Diospyros lotus TaxID=55363 RepID=UPI00225B075C|nr:uncharacterized protein LOC127795227 [Diospyros lotus]
MPLLDIATTAQPSIPNHIFTLRAQTLSHNRIVFGNEKRLASGWKPFQASRKEKKIYLGRVEMLRNGLVISAVATLESCCSVQTHGEHEGRDNLQPAVDSSSNSVIQHQSSASNRDSEELDEREKLRRMRISKANKGNTPWNKGRKHSAETLQRIKERTRLAMQDPKVKMKLVNLGHAQSKETREKIAVGVRMGWERRRQKLMLQETCYFEWQNLIAGASRRGFVGEEELQWDSYTILDKQLEQEWLESVEQRRSTPRLKGSKRAPKSLEQRRKISEAISAKWTDPAYRERVYSALSKYHGTAVGVERKPRRKPSVERQPRTRSPTKKKSKDTGNSGGNVTKSQNPCTRSRRSNVPQYKDPLANSKLEMIKNIRAQRAAVETKKTEAFEQAKILIAEAEKAAKALEAAAMRSPLAQASLVEARKLIAEAIQSIQPIEIGQADSHENGSPPSAVAELTNPENGSPLTALAGPMNPENGIEGLNQIARGEINGTRAVESGSGDIKDFGFHKFDLQDLLNGGDDDDDDDNEVDPVNSRGYGLLNGKEQLPQSGSSDNGLPPSELDSILNQSNFREQLSQLGPNGSNNPQKKKLLLLNGAEFQSGKEEEASPKSITITRKWVCGRLVEVAEED